LNAASVGLQTFEFCAVALPCVAENPKVQSRNHLLLLRTDWNLFSPQPIVALPVHQDSFGQGQKRWKDEKTRCKFIPDYQLGCKRMLVSEDFYPTFNLPPVTLETITLARLEENGIVTSDYKNREVDVIVYATDFRVADVESYIQIYKIGSKSLSKKLENNGAEAYKGILVPGYLNLCFFSI
jgi:cation diffusion facilitator CzcD-associated flavoprotein CzcO